MFRIGWIVFILSAMMLTCVPFLQAKCPDVETALPARLHELVVKAEDLAQSGRPENAARLLLDYLEKNPKDSYAYVFYDLGWFFNESKNLKEAVVHLKKAVNLNPCFVEAFQLLASVYNEAEQFKNAADAIEKAASLAGDNDMLYQAAVFRIKAGQIEKALPLLEKLVEQREKKAQWWAAMANARQLLKQPEKAARAMAEAAKLGGDREYQFQTALLWLEAKNPKNALPILEKLSKLKSPEPEWLVALSNALSALKKKVETARAMEKAARISNNPDMVFRAAYLWLEADRPKNALPLLQMLTKRKNPKLDWLLALCNTYVTLDQTVPAAKTMDQIIRMDDSPDYLYNGGLLWLQADNAKKALPHLLRLCKLKNPKADWFAALAHAWIKSDDIPKAADAMERAAEISKKPEYSYNAGTLRLQLQQPDRALTLLLPIVDLPEPKAEWWIAVSNARVLKEEYARAAQAMENAANISGKNEHFFRSAQLWLQGDEPLRALPLLRRLAASPSPKAQWLVVLSNTHLILKNNREAADAMEQAARISGKAEHYHRAAMLWRQEDDLEKTAGLLKICVKISPRQDWLVDLADVSMALDRKKDARQALNKAVLTDRSLKPDLRYRGAVLLWLTLNEPEKAAPILEVLCNSPDPGYPWMVSYIKTNVELNRIDRANKELERLLNRWPEKPESWRLATWLALQQSDFAGAAAAKEVDIRLSEANNEALKKLSELYHMAGAPTKAAEVYEHMLGNQPRASDLDELTGIYLSGQRYDLALAPAKAAVAVEETAKRWEVVGDIQYHLRRFDKSCDAYQKASLLSDSGNIQLKTAYSQMKLENWQQAAISFQKAMDLANDKPSITDQASKNLAYIQSIQEFYNPDHWRRE